MMPLQVKTFLLVLTIEASHSESLQDYLAFTSHYLCYLEDLWRQAGTSAGVLLAAYFPCPPRCPSSLGGLPRCRAARDYKP